MKRTITNSRMAAYRSFLYLDEKSKNTIDKYMRDIRRFRDFAGNREIDKRIVKEYKSLLHERYQVTSANSMVASINSYLRFEGWEDCCIKQFKVQKKIFCSQEKELLKAEYIRLVNTAKMKGNERLNLILQTICSTGIRVSELRFITLEAVRKGEAVVSCKSKTRTIFIVRKLQKRLLRYARSKEVKSGCIFITRSGKPVSRCNIWREMKSLCGLANVPSEKVFPHNLRHLFARIFYGLEKDIAGLADVLGHSCINTTRIYIITSGAEHKRKMETMKLII